MGKKILLADDSITIQKVIELTFSDEDFEVVTVGNGRLAVEKVQEVRPDIVLCDIIMPEKDGYDVCDFIKKTPGLAQTPVLLLTGAFEPFDQERAARVGCDGFLAKPFEPETLIARVKDLLAKAAAKPAAAPPPAPRAPEPPPAPAPAAQMPPIAPVQSAPPPTPFASVPPPPPAPAFAREPEMEVAFIPDEPFEELDSASFEPEPLEPAAGAAPPLPFEEPTVFDAPLYAVADETPAEELLPMTTEESESLAAPPDESARTVMFKAHEVPWGQAPRAEPGPPASPASEVPIFEEVLEEESLEASTASFRVPLAEPSFPEPPAVVPPPFVAPPPVFEPPPPPAAPPPLAAAPRPEPVPAPPPARPEPPPATEPDASFADLAAEVAAPAAPPPPSSQAAEVAVPMDMVETIAQRVVAQISEKVVRQIAWEVIPDLAEAMIRKEIERLKAELQETP